MKQIDERALAVVRYFPTIHPMRALEVLFHRFSKRRHARWWIGKRPAVRTAQIPQAIAKQVGLPTSADTLVSNDCMISLSKADAGYVLAVAGTTSLAYGKQSASRSALEDANNALNDLMKDATFLSNGDWKPNSAMGWNPLTTATFDCGVIGFDHENAFIFWVEEED